MLQMGDQQAKKQLIDSNSGRDFLSDLPQPIIENILMRLQTEEAIRTCVLSKEWRYAWCTIPKLVIFEKDDVDEDSDYDCRESVNTLLSNHRGPMNKFTLYMDDPAFEDLDQWIQVLGSKGVNDLTFCFDPTEDHEIPPSLFSHLLHLTKLRLRGCIIDVPHSFEGFKLLCKIELDMVKFVGGNIEKLVSSCPLLEDLKLIDLHDCLGNLVIRSENLEKLRIVGNFKHLLLDTPKLFSLFIFPETDYVNGNLKQVEGEYLTIFNDLDQDTEITCAFNVQCNMNTTPRKPIQLNHLTQIFIIIDLSDEEDQAAALCLFKIAPRLQDLCVKFSGGRGTLYKNFWESESGANLFTCLRTVTINSMDSDGAVFIVKFVEFVLRTAPVLENVIIRDIGVEAVMYGMKNPYFLQMASQKDYSMRRMRLDLLTIFEVLKFPRLSNKATIEFKDDNYDLIYGQSAKN